MEYENKKKRTSFNIGILGGFRVGKTSLINSYLSNQFQDNYPSTIGNEIVSDKMKIDGKEYNLKIFDTSGQERFKSISCSVIKKSQIIIIVYDITNHITFEELKDWVKIVDENRNHDCIIGLVGNKIDLFENIEVSQEEIKEFANLNNYKYFETSAKERPTYFKTIINNLVEDYFYKFSEERNINPIILEDSNAIRRRREKNCCSGNYTPKSYNSSYRDYNYTKKNYTKSSYTTNYTTNTNSERVNLINEEKNYSCCQRFKAKFCKCC